MSKELVYIEHTFVGLVLLCRLFHAGFLLLSGASC